MELEDFAADSNITFNTSMSKSKCMYVVGNKRSMEKPAFLTLFGRFLPLVEKVEHLGNILSSQDDMDQDAAHHHLNRDQGVVQICCSIRGSKGLSNIMQLILWIFPVGSWRSKGQAGL